MGPIEAGLKYRKITLLIFIILVAAGAAGFLSMPRYEDPQFKIFTARVMTIYPGATPEQVETLVTAPLEEKIDEMKEIQKIYSRSSNGVSVIYVKLAGNADREKAWDELRQKVHEARPLLPAGAGEPEVNDELNRTCNMILHLVAPPGKPARVLREVAEDWREALKQVNGVEKVEIVGLPEEQVRVSVDSAALAARQLSWLHLAEALQNRNVNIPGGILREGQMGLLVESTGEYRSLEEIKNTVIYRPPGGAAVRVSDVAQVEIAPARAEEIVETNGRPSLALAIYVKEGQSIFQAEKGINAKLKELEEDLPPDTEAVVVFNQSESVRLKFNDLKREFLTGMGVVLFICILALQLRTAVIVALAIPTSMAVGFAFLAPAGLHLHQISIAALIIALGILIDDAIVVNDNIERHLALGAERYAAALHGTREVAVSILTATVATVSSFIPLALLRGDIGEFIRALPVVVSVTMLASMVVSLWLTPALRYWLVRPGAVKHGPAGEGLLGRALDKLGNWYGNRLAATLKRPALTVGLALGLSAVALALLPFMGVQFFPAAERPEFLIDIETPRGCSLDETHAIARKVADLVREKPGVEGVYTYAGTQVPKFYYNEIPGVRGETVAQLAVLSQNRQVTRKLVNELRDELPGHFPGTRVTVRELEQGPPVGAPVAVRIHGKDIETLRQLAQQVSDILENTPGTVNVYDDMGLDHYTLRVNPNPELTTRWGVAEEDIARSVRMAVDGLEISSFREKDRLLPVVIYAGTASKPGVAAISSLWVPARNTGAVLPLEQVASVEAGWTSGDINRHNLERVVTVRSYTDNTLASTIIDSAAERIKSIPLPPGYRIEYGGETEERDEAFASIGKLSILVVFLIYLIIAMQFYSLTRPAIILISVYLAFCGSVLALFITGAPIGFMALLGIVSLSGIVVRNGIVLLDFIENRLQQGFPLHDAIREAGRVRLRPILLTSTTAVGGLAPMAIMGGSLWRPMAMSIIGGLVFSTVLTLVVVPNMYLLLHNLKRRLKKS